MTDVLRETLEERGRATPWEDVDALVAAGDRRVRRRRVAGVVAAAVTVAVLALVTPLALGGLGRDEVQVTDAAYEASAPSWAVDGTVHVGDLEVDLGKQPDAYVLTDAGIVWINASGDVSLTAASGQTDVIGSSGGATDRALVTDGRYVAWLDREAQEIVEYDAEAGLVAGGETFANLPGNGRIRQPELIALDDGDLWWYDRRANQINTLKEPEANSQTSVGDSDGGGEPLDVEGGHLARSTPGNSIEIYRPGSDGRPTRIPGQDIAMLSPEGTYVVTKPRDQFVVYGVDDASRRIGQNGDALFIPTRWLDDDSLEYLGSNPDRDGDLDLLTCSISRMSCEAVAEDVAQSLEEVTVADGMVDNE